MKTWIPMMAAGILIAAAASAYGDKPNVLLILADDLKPTLGCYGDATAITPHIDSLAARGMRFELSYCNQAVCAPSRFAMLLGSRPTSTGLYGLGSSLRKVLPDAVTMPQYFARFGYRTESLGKVFHVGHGNRGDPSSWSVPPFEDKVIEYVDPASTQGGKLTREEAYFTNQQLDRIRELPRGAAFESPDVEDAAYADGRVAEEAVRRLRAAKTRRETQGTPFFLAVGFARPHLPFSVPKRFWDMYDPALLPLPEWESPPRNAPRVALKTNGELANYAPVPNDGWVSDDALKRRLIHGYYAAVSYMDAQVGKVLTALDELGLEDDTIVILWGDNGFHLGDHGLWTKHTNYEQAARVPLIIAAPGVTLPGSATRQLAEGVDIFPTLCDLAGLPPPELPQSIDGVSLAPVLRDPNARVRDHAYHIFPHAKLGRAVRTERYRLVEWRGIDQPAETAEFELYDYQTDPLETKNLAAELPEVVTQLRAVLARHPEPVRAERPRAPSASAAGR
ncbi:sulfatase [Thermopirellula anaerolimosa]